MARDACGPGIIRAGLGIEHTAERALYGGLSVADGGLLDRDEERDTRVPFVGESQVDMCGRPGIGVVAIVIRIGPELGGECESRETQEKGGRSEKDKNSSGLEYYHIFLAY
jgi:hypothetical protein